MRRATAALLAISFLALVAERPAASHVEGMAQYQFAALMERLAAAWNEGDARAAADCFTENAVYSEPPAKLLFRGREALYEFFGGESGRARAMHMVWHHLAYNPETRVGMGEFSFWIGDDDPSHGVIVVRIEGGRIANLREYYYESKLHWEEFTAANPF